MNNTLVFADDTPILALAREVHTHGKRLKYAPVSRLVEDTSSVFIMSEYEAGKLSDDLSV